MPEEERESLLEVANSRWRRKSALICLCLVTLGVSALVSAILLCYFRYWEANSPSIKVLSLNTWGMPATFGSYDKELRMAAIGDFINKTEHDVYLLEELWMRPDHNNIRARIPADWFMTTTGEMSNGFCDGEIAPDGCSGLAIVSKFPFIERSFHGYSVKGRVSDGEVLASKGVGKVRIEPFPGHIVDVFVTHTCASDDNSDYRQKQVKELVGIVKESKADFVILGGDFNSDPVVNKNETTLKDITDIMVSSISEIFLKLENWLIPKKATYGNPENTYSYTYSPVHYDYIFHMANHGNMMWTSFFDIPLFKTKKDASHEVSFSDHEAVTAKLFLKKPLPAN